MNPAITEAELEAFALEFGATVKDEGGRVFNAQGRKITPKLKKPEPPKVDPTQALLEKISELVNRPVDVQVNVPAPPAARVMLKAAEPPKVSAWTFEFERNDDGTIKRIHATPKD
jgi:hypothetical protein